MHHHTGSSAVNQLPDQSLATSSSNSTDNVGDVSEDGVSATTAASTSTAQQKRPGTKDRLRIYKIGPYFDVNERNYAGLFEDLNLRLGYHTTQGAFANSRKDAFRSLSNRKVPGTSTKPKVKTSVAQSSSNGQGSEKEEGAIMHEDFNEYMHEQGRIERQRVGAREPKDVSTTAAHLRWLNGSETARDDSKAEVHLAMLKRAIRKQWDDLKALPNLNSAQKDPVAASEGTAPSVGDKKKEHVHKAQATPQGVQGPSQSVQPQLSSSLNDAGYRRGLPHNDDSSPFSGPRLAPKRRRNPELADEMAHDTRNKFGDLQNRNEDLPAQLAQFQESERAQFTSTSTSSSTDSKPPLTTGTSTQKAPETKKSRGTAGACDGKTTRKAVRKTKAGKKASGRRKMVHDYSDEEDNWPEGDEESDDYDEDSDEMDQQAELDSEDSFSVHTDGSDRNDDEDNTLDGDEGLDVGEPSEDDERPDAILDAVQHDLADEPLLGQFWIDLADEPFPWQFLMDHMPSLDEETWASLEPRWRSLAYQNESANDTPIEVAAFSTRLREELLQLSRRAFAAFAVLGGSPVDIEVAYLQSLVLVDWHADRLHQPAFVEAARDVMAELYAFTRTRSNEHHPGSFRAGSPSNLDFHFG